MSSACDIDRPIWLFCGMDMESSGGLSDCRGRYSTVEDALRELRDENNYWSKDWIHIVDVRTGEVIDKDEFSGAFLRSLFTVRVQDLP